jgi:hypothetical protein
MLCIPLLLSGFCMAETDLSKLYTSSTEFKYENMLVDVKGYKVPTIDAFKGWVILNRAGPKVQAIANYFKERGVANQNTMPLHLVLLQGTDWALNDTSLFTLPNSKHLDNMVNTLVFIQTYVEPEVGIVIPVSGERAKIYNDSAGGAPRSKHLDFCALDLIPKEDWSRKELHKKIKAIWYKFGKEHNVGLGLYAGVRFHIDTCGYRTW